MTYHQFLAHHTLFISMLTTYGELSDRQPVDELFKPT